MRLYRSGCEGWVHDSSGQASLDHRPTPIHPLLLFTRFIGQRRIFPFCFRCLGCGEEQRDASDSAPSVSGCDGFILDKLRLSVFSATSVPVMDPNSAACRERFMVATSALISAKRLPAVTSISSWFHEETFLATGRASRARARASTSNRRSRFACSRSVESFSLASLFCSYDARFAAAATMRGALELIVRG